jgi:hypothetical protein
MDSQISREAWMLLHGAQPDDEYESSYRRADRLRELEERGFLQDAPLSAEVTNARRASFTEALQRLMEARRQPYQLPIPGVNPTLMELRSREPISPQAAAAAGLEGAGWQRVPQMAYATEQLEFTYPSSQQMPEREKRAFGAEELEEIKARNAVVQMLRRQGRSEQQIEDLMSVHGAADTNQLPAVEAAVEQAKNSRVPVGPSGRRMALRYGAPTLGALLGLYGLAAVTGGSEPQREYSETR